MYSHERPALMQLRTVVRDGRRWLQQYRNKPGGYAYEFDWVDVCELPPLLAPVSRLPIRRS
jgi:hypothetical protein